MLVTYLQAHPIIGMLSAWAGAGMGFIMNVFTSDATLRLIGMSSIYVGFFVGLLTGLIKLIELFRLVRKK